MEKLQWFKFAPSDWMMGKILKCPEITQARFMKLCCLYWNKECNLSYEDAEIEIDEEHLEMLIKKKVVKVVEDSISIEFLNEQMEGISETSEKRRAAVKKRWDKVKQDKASALQNDTSVLQNDTEKRREEKSRVDVKEANASHIEDNISKKESSPQEERKKVPVKKESFNWDSLLKFINKTTGKKFRVINKKAKLKFNSRIKDGYTKEDISNTIINAVKSEFHKENNFQYLTPEYFARAETIDKFSQVVVDSEKTVAPKMNT